MSKNIKDFFKPVHSDISSYCPEVPQAAVLAAQKEIVKEEEKASQSGKKRGPYQEISSENRAKIGKYAAETGVTACIRHFKSKGKFTDLKESTVRGWMNAYKKEMKTAGKSVTTLSEKRKGRPLLIGEELEDQVKSFLCGVRSSGGVINAPITVAVARGIVTTKDANLLAENGGGISLTLDLSINKSLKDHLRNSFQLWYAEEVKKQLDEEEHKAVDLKLSWVKPLGAKWFINAFAHIKNNADIIKNGFQAAGITGALYSQTDL